MTLLWFFKFIFLKILLLQHRSSGFLQDNRLRLAAEEFRIKRRQELQQIIRRRVSSEEEHLKKQQQELQTLLFAEEQGSGCNALHPQVALALARATRDALTAEEEAAKLRVLECEQLLETLKDAAEDAHARVEDANFQIGQILSIFDRQGIQVDLRKKIFEPSQSPHPFSMTDSGCCFFQVLPPIPSPQPESWHSDSQSSCSQSDSEEPDGNSEGVQVLEGLSNSNFSSLPLPS